MGWTVAIAPTAYTPQIATDSTVRTIASTSFGQLSGNFSIPANDAEAGSVYKLTMWGTYTTSTVITYTLELQIFGSTMSTLVLPNSIASGTNVPYTLDVWVMITTAGAGGALVGSYRWVSGATAAAGITVVSNFSASVSTVAASSLEIQAKESITTSGQNIVGTASIYERDGPGAVAA